MPPSRSPQPFNCDVREQRALLSPTLSSRGGEGDAAGSFDRACGSWWRIPAPRTLSPVMGEQRAVSNHICGQDTDGFFEGSLAGDGAGETVLPQGAHALLDGNVLEGGGRELLEHGLAERLIHQQ